MKVYEAIRKVEFEDVWNEFVNYWQEVDVGVHVTEFMKKANMCVYNELGKMKPKDNIRAKIIVRHIEELAIIYDAEPEITYATDFIAWDEIIAMRINNLKGSEDQQASVEQFLASLLFDITFHGYDQEIIQEEFARLKLMVNEVKEKYREKP